MKLKQSGLYRMDETEYLDYLARHYVPAYGPKEDYINRSLRRWKKRMSMTDAEREEIRRRVDAEQKEFDKLTGADKDFA